MGKLVMKFASWFQGESKEVVWRRRAIALTIYFLGSALTLLVISGKLYEWMYPDRVESEASFYSEVQASTFSTEYFVRTYGLENLSTEVTSGEAKNEFTVSFYNRWRYVAYLHIKDYTYDFKYKDLTESGNWYIYHNQTFYEPVLKDNAVAICEREREYMAPVDEYPDELQGLIDFVSADFESMGYSVDSVRTYLNPDSSICDLKFLLGTSHGFVRQIDEAHYHVVVFDSLYNIGFTENIEWIRPDSI